MRLSVLLTNIAEVSEGVDCDITSITLDSREVVSGALFVALNGTQQHGLIYAEKAQEMGAVAIIWESGKSIKAPSLDIPCIEVPHLRQKLGQVANRFYSSPSQSLNMIGITGTDGKTSVSHFLAQAVNDSAVIGTIGIGALNDLQTATHTTPDVLSVHKNLLMLKNKAIKTVAMEVSSHALDQGRVDNVLFDVAVLTNLSSDHLDYHGTVKAYAEAKQKLFSSADLKAVVVNLEDKFGRILANKSKQDVKVIGYSVGEQADCSNDVLLAYDVVLSEQGVAANVSYKGQTAKLNAAVLGRFNISNLLASLGAMLALEWSLPDALDQLNQVTTVAGRMEKVSETGILAVVDYAHTANALGTVLNALREHTQGKLICVFGCGGDRDTSKRPLMAEVAEKLADVVIVTDDNPRTESPEKIMQDIITGFKDAQRVHIEHDRAKAIAVALSQAKQGDTVLIAGKGHENVQILATETLPFSDKEQANKILQELAA